MVNSKESVKQKIEAVITTGRRFYQPVVDFPQCTGRSIIQFQSRLDAIMNHNPTANSYLIGGSSNGFNAFQLVKAGKQVVGVEIGKNDIEFCKLLAEYYNLDSSNPEFVQDNILNYLRRTDKVFDCALLLMVWHHIFKANSIPQALETMNLLAHKAKYTYLSTRDKPWMKEQLNMTYMDTPEYIINNTEFNYWEEIQIPRKGNGQPNIAFSLPIWVMWR